MFQFRGATYRVAGARDIAQLIVSHLWDWIYKSGITKEKVISWFRRFTGCDLARAADYDENIFPSSLLVKISKIMSDRGWGCGDLGEAFADALENPPPGFRWRADKYGKHTLVEVKSVTTEKAIVRGKRFADSIFVGVWWVTGTPRGTANQTLQRFIRKNGGAVFWNTKAEFGRQYGAFIITDKDNGESLATELCTLADRADLEGGGEHRLSAIHMAGIAENREVRNSDQIWIGCIRSIKFNWKHSLPDLLNGRIEDFRTSREYQDLIRLLRER